MIQHDPVLRCQWNFPPQPCLLDELVIGAHLPQVCRSCLSRAVDRWATRQPGFLPCVLATMFTPSRWVQFACLRLRRHQCIALLRNLVADNLPHPASHAQNVRQSEHDKDLDTYTLSDMSSLPSSHLFLASSTPRKLQSSSLLASLIVEEAESSNHISETKHTAFLQPGTDSI